MGLPSKNKSAEPVYLVADGGGNAGSREVGRCKYSAHGDGSGPRPPRFWLNEVTGGEEFTQGQPD